MERTRVSVKQFEVTDSVAAEEWSSHGAVEPSNRQVKHRAYLL